MANSAQARKRVRQNEKRRLHNTSQRSEMRTAIKRTLKAIESKSTDAAKAGFKTAEVLIDRLAGRGLIHPNKAARLKSRLNTKLKSNA